jgi:hypothetical protein
VGTPATDIVNGNLSSHLICSCRFRAGAGCSPGKRRTVHRKRGERFVLNVGWLDVTLAGAMVLTAVHHLGRPVTARQSARPCELDVNLAHAAMGVAMAAMLLGPLAGRPSWAAAAMAVPTLWFLCRGVHAYVMYGRAAAAHPMREALLCAAMLYMLAARGGHRAMGMPGMTPAAGPTTLPAAPALTVLFVLALAMVAVRTVPAAGRAHRAGSSVAPAATAGCQLAMIGTSGYMLALML